MKSISFFFFLISFTLSAQTDTARIWFATENPRYFGSEARSYFMITEMKEASLQKKINDSIRNWFSEKASLSLCRSGDPLLLRRPYPTPLQRKYKCPNPCATDPAYVLITHADSITLFSPSEINPVNNAGTSACLVNAHVLNNKIIFLGVTGGKHEKTKSQDTDAFFDLASGKKINPDTRIRWKKEKEDSLIRTVKNFILREKESCTSCAISITAPDSAQMSNRDLILYFRGGDALVSFRYSIAGNSGTEKIDPTGTVNIPLREIRNWLSKDYFEQLEKIKSGK